MANAPPEENASPAHVSFSQYSEWLKCGKAYELKKVLGFAEQPAWWNLGGKGVHAATEAYDRLTMEVTA